MNVHVITPDQIDYQTGYLKRWAAEKITSKNRRPTAPLSQRATSPLAIDPDIGELTPVYIPS